MHGYADDVQDCACVIYSEGVILYNYYNKTDYLKF